MKKQKRYTLNQGTIVLDLGSTSEIERDRLFKKVGQLQIEVDWLKKKTGYLG